MGCGEYGFLSQPEVLRGGVVGLDFKTPFARLEGQTPVSGSRCLIHWLTHPDFQRKSCDKGLEAVTKQPRGAAVMAMTYQDQVPNTVTLKVWYHTSRCALARGVSTLMQVTCASAISMRKACLSTLVWLSSSGAEPNQQNYFS